MTSCRARRSPIPSRSSRPTIRSRPCKKVSGRPRCPGLTGPGLPRAQYWRLAGLPRGGPHARCALPPRRTKAEQQGVPCAAGLEPRACERRAGLLVGRVAGSCGSSPAGWARVCARCWPRRRAWLRAGFVVRVWVGVSASRVPVLVRLP